MLHADILIISPSISMGGIQNASVNLANELVDLDNRVVFVTLFKHEHFFQLDNKIEFIEPSNQLNSRSLSIFKSIIWLRKEIKKVNPKVVLIYNKLYAAIGSISTFGLGVTLAISERSSPFYDWGWQTELISKIFFSIRPPEKVISQTQIAAEVHQKVYPRSEVTVIPNALRDVALFPEIKRKQVLLCVGRFGDTCKGFDRMLHAFHAIQNKSWELWFAGVEQNEGEELLASEGLLKSAIVDRIRFLGKRKDIDRIYAQAGIFVIPSRSEGFPNALCEAMAAGCPCISFDFIAGPRDILSPGQDGVIVPDGNIPSLAHAIDELIEDPLRRQKLGDAAKAISERLAPKKIAQQHLDFMFSTDSSQPKHNS